MFPKWDVDTVTIEGKTYTIEEYTAKLERKEIEHDVEADFKVRRFFRLPIRERGKGADKNKVVSTRYFTPEESRMEKNIKEQILLAIFRNHASVPFTTNDIQQDKDLIQYKPSRSNIQLTLSTLYGTLKDDPEYADTIHKEQKGQSVFYTIHPKTNLAFEDFKEGGKIYTAMTEYQKKKKLKRAGVSVPEKRTKIQQGNSKQSLVPKEQKQVLSVQPLKDMNINVSINVGGFVKFLFGFYKGE